MTKPDAEQELAALEEKERIAWAACEHKLSERDVFESQWISEYQEIRNLWTPLHYRKQQLKTYLEIA